jgi:hypothetical protein
MIGKKAAAGFSEMLASVCQASWHHFPEGCNLKVVDIIANESCM